MNHESAVGKWRDCLYHDLSIWCTPWSYVNVERESTNKAVGVMRCVIILE